MSAPIAAEGGLAASVDFVEQMIRSAGQGRQSLETTAAALEGNSWSGEAVDGFRRAMDFYDAASASLIKAKDGLTPGFQVKDAYQGATQAGTKESILGD